VTYALYGATLALTWFVIVNGALSVIVAIAADQVAIMTAQHRPRSRARTLLALRLLPSLASLAFVAAVVVPSYLRLEPRNFDEAFGWTTTAATIVATALVVAACWRAVGACWRATSRARACVRAGHPMTVPSARLPVCCIDSRDAAMTLVGVLRARLLVTRPLVDVLTPEEMQAAVAHEMGHYWAWDNLKRLTIHGAPDALSLLAAGRRLEREWTLAAEHAADARAAGDPATALALASALVKVARLTTIPAFSLAPVSPLVGGEAIASRVERLVNPLPSVQPSLRARIAWWSLGIVTVAAFALTYFPLLAVVHGASEILVRALP